MAKALATKTIAKRLNLKHGIFMDSLKTSLEYAIEIGEELAKVKASMDYGDYTPWCEENLTFSMRQAQVYMQVAENKEKVDDATSLSGALEMIRPEKDEELHIYVSSAVEEVEQEPPKIKPVKKIDGAYWYWHDLDRLSTEMIRIYEKLAPKRGHKTPLGLGAVIGNIRQMANTLRTWDPIEMAKCEFCEGTKQIEVEGKMTTCKYCINGKGGSSRPTKY